MTGLIISVSAAVIPALFLMHYFQKNDRFPEPARVVWTTFLLGIAIIPPVIVVANLFTPFVEVQTDPWRAALYEAFFQAALPEDIAKFCILFFYCAPRTHFNEPMDGIVYGAAASMGFAAMENIFYVLDGGLDVALMRALTAVPAHCANGIIMGYFIALFELSRRDARGMRIQWGDMKYLIPAIAIPVLAHTLYDFPLMLLEKDFDPSLHWVFVITLATLIGEIVLAYWLFRRVRRLQHTTPVTPM